MNREISILAFFGIICTFLVIHYTNLQSIENQNLENLKHKLSQENNLINEGTLIKLSNGVTIKRNFDLIIIEQQSKTIILNNSDSNQIIAFLED